MPIEFRCPSCSKLLRTPDESAGKKAKCPQCGGIADVPAIPTATPSGSTSPASGDNLLPLPPIPPSFAGGGAGPAKPPTSPFDGPSFDSPSFGGSSNPYASPAAVAYTPTASTVAGPIVPTRISFDRVFETVWAVFRPQMGQMAVLGLVVLGVNIGLQILSQGGSVAAQATGEQAIFIAFTALNTLFGMVVQTWITIGNNIYMLKAARNEQPSINDLGRSGPFLIRAILLQLVFGLVVGAAFLGAATLGWITYMATNQQEAAFIVAGITILILALPLIYLFYGWFIAMYLIIDRNLGVMESISLSSKCMAGNRLTAFLIMLVVGMLGMLFVVFTCCLGYVLFVPYMSLALTGIYLSATGQSWGPGTGTRVG